MSSNSIPAYFIKDLELLRKENAHVTALSVVSLTVQLMAMWRRLPYKEAEHEAIAR